MEQYVGMNFKKWCALDENDSRTMHIDLYYDGLVDHFTSNDEIEYVTMLMLQKSTILKIDLKNNEWFIVLNFDSNS